MVDSRARKLGIDASLRLGERYFVIGQLAFFAINAVATIYTFTQTPAILESPAIAVAAATSVFGLTLALAIRWSELPRRMRIIVPLFNTTAVACLCVAVGTGPVTALMIIPVIELALRFRNLGAALGIMLVIGLTTLQFATALDYAGIVSPTSLAIIFICAVAAVIVAALARHIDSLWTVMAAQSTRADSLALQSRRDRHVLDVVLNTITVGVMSIDTNGRPLVVNAWQRDLIQSSTDVTVIQCLADVDMEYVERDGVTPVPDDLRPHIRAMRGESFDGMVIWVHTSRGLVALSVSARPIFTSEGEHEGTVIVSQEVTDSLNALTARDVLVSSVSHELRTPLTSVIGYLEMASEDPTVEPETHTWIVKAISGSEQLLSIVSDLLTAASLESGAFILAKRPVDLTEIVREAVDFMRPQSAKRNIAIDVHLYDQPVVIDADAQRLRQVFDNILVNATKYSNQGTKIRVTQTVDDETVKVRITDHGMGMSQEDVENATARFFRSQAARQSGVDGTGLGLFISQSVISGHNGTLNIESEAGVGTSVTITLPRIGRMTRSIPVTVSVAKG